MAQDIPVIVIAGGPDAEKQQVIEHLEQHFSSLGFDVRIIPNAAAFYLNLGGPDRFGMHCFQSMVLERCVDQERGARADIVEKGVLRPLILSNDGVMDIASYVEPEEFQALWDEVGYDYLALRDNRYTGVIHLRTTTDEEAVVNRRTLAAWNGSPHLARIEPHISIVETFGQAIAWAAHFIDGGLAPSVPLAA